MAPFRSRGRGGSRGGGSRGRGRGRGSFRGSRGAPRDGARDARSGIRTKNGYRKFDSQRVRDLDEVDDDQTGEEESDAAEESLSDDEDVEDNKPAVKSYVALLQSLYQPEESGGERKAKRRRVEQLAEPVVEDLDSDSNHLEPGQEEEEGEGEEPEDDEFPDLQEDGTDEDDKYDPFEVHFANPDDNELSRRLKVFQSIGLQTEKQTVAKKWNAAISRPSGATYRLAKLTSPADLPLKERLAKNLPAPSFLNSEENQLLASHVFNYEDALVGTRSTQNAARLRSMASLHAVNHILKGRDKVIKNNERLRNAEAAADLDLRDQGFVRPKVLILTETRQMAANYANSIVDCFKPEQQENRRRFEDSFTGPQDDREFMPEDYRELFGGNNDNSFLTALKFTRKTLKFYSAFYNSDIILASPLGLRRVIENEDVKKRDNDFLSSVEIVVADQADAMYMQNWENVEVVFNHLNLELKETHGCDFSRVRNWYLDGNAKYLRQTILFSAYITPEMNHLYTSHMQNIAGKVKLTTTYPGAITETSGLGIKQTFSRFNSSSPIGDPDARFEYFKTAILPRLLRLPRPSDGAQGILIFIPSYFDFLRVRNYFASSAQTENTAFGAIHDYSEVSEQRRARSHFSNGRHSILLYTQRAHHFFRLKIRGVKRVVLYGLPDNPIFYQELVEGFVGTSIAEGKLNPAEASVKSVFSKWDGLRLERIAGSERIKGMLGGADDTFDFV